MTLSVPKSVWRCPLNKAHRIIVKQVVYDKNEIYDIGLRELCWNNFGNFEATQYSRIIPEIIKHKRNNEEHNTSNSCLRMVKDGQIKGPNWGQIVSKEMS